MAKGITGAGQGFDLPGRRLGGYSRQPPLPSLRKTALEAAEKRARLGSLLPSGPKRIGGNSIIMKALSPAQAAAMAAEQRLQDEIWCGSQSSAHLDKEDVDYDDAENIVHKGENVGTSRLPDNSTLPSKLLSRKRSQDTSSSLLGSSSSSSELIDLTMDTPKRGSKRSCCGSETISHSQSNFHEGPSSANLSSVSVSGDSRTFRSDESGMWECTMCTLLNNVSIQIFLRTLFFR